MRTRRAGLYHPGGREQPAGLVGVGAHLGGQLLDVGEDGLAAEAVGEGDRHPVPVQVAVEVEHVGLDPPPLGAELGVGADADRRRPGHTVQAVGEVAGVDAVGGDGDAVRQVQVGGGHTEHGAAAPVAGDHHPLDGVEAAEGGGRRGHVAGGQLGPDPGRGDDLAAVGVQADGDHLDPPGPAQVGQQVRVAGRLVAEAEVLPHHHRPGAQAAEEHVGGERLRPHLGQLGGEGQHQHDLDAGLAQQLDLAVQRGEQRRLAPGPQDGQGVAVEGDRGRGHAPGGRLGGHPVQQRPVPPVDPVEHPNGDHGRPQPGRDGGNPVVPLPPATVTPAPPWGGRGRRCPG